MVSIIPVLPIEKLGVGTVPGKSGSAHWLCCILYFLLVVKSWHTRPKELVSFIFHVCYPIWPWQHPWQTDKVLCLLMNKLREHTHTHTKTRAYSSEAMGWIVMLSFLIRPPWAITALHQSWFLWPQLVYFTMTHLGLLGWPEEQSTPCSQDILIVLYSRQWWIHICVYMLHVHVHFILGTQQH